MQGRIKRKQSNMQRRRARLSARKRLTELQESARVAPPHVSASFASLRGKQPVNNPLLWRGRALQQTAGANARGTGAQRGAETAQGGRLGTLAAQSRASLAGGAAG